MTGTGMNVCGHLVDGSGMACLWSERRRWPGGSERQARQNQHTARQRSLHCVLFGLVLHYGFNMWMRKKLNNLSKEAAELCKAKGNSRVVIFLYGFTSQKVFLFTLYILICSIIYFINVKNNCSGFINIACL